MNDIIKQQLTQYNVKNNWPIDDKSLIETLKESGKHIWRDNGFGHRWWIEYFNVVELDGMLIGYNDTQTTGDKTAKEVGYDFDISSICEVISETKTITVYHKKI